MQWLIGMECYSGRRLKVTDDWDGFEDLTTAPPPEWRGAATWQEAVAGYVEQHELRPLCAFGLEGVLNTAQEYAPFHVFVLDGRISVQDYAESDEDLESLLTQMLAEMQSTGQYEDSRTAAELPAIQ